MWDYRMLLLSVKLRKSQFCTCDNSTIEKIMFLYVLFALLQFQKTSVNPLRHLVTLITYHVTQYESCSCLLFLRIGYVNTVFKDKSF